MKKGRMYLTATLVALGVLLPALAKADAIVSVSSPATAAVGDTITVDVNVTGAADLYAYQFDLGFNPTVLSAVSVTEGSFLSAGGSTIFLPGTIDNTIGSISANADTLTGAIAGVTGDGSLLTIQFSVIGTGTSELALGNLFFLDSNLNLLNVESTGASISASQGTAAPEPGTLLLMLCGITGVLAASCAKTRRLESSQVHSGLLNS